MQQEIDNGFPHFYQKEPHVFRKVCAVRLAVLKVHLKTFDETCVAQAQLHHSKLCCPHKYAFHYRPNHDCHIFVYHLSYV